MYYLVISVWLVDTTKILHLVIPCRFSKTPVILSTLFYNIIFYFLQVEVQPGSIYGGFARSCVAKTMEDMVENEYLVTDENGCATDPTIFGEWDYNADTQSLLASFHAFKFPSSDNIRFQCNIRVCFGKCQPVSCFVSLNQSIVR